MGNDERCNYCSYSNVFPKWCLLVIAFGDSTVLRKVLFVVAVESVFELLRIDLERCEVTLTFVQIYLDALM